MHVHLLKGACNADKFLHLSSYLQKKLSWWVVSFVGSRYLSVLSVFFKMGCVSSLEL